jgi:hypothetical protein
VTEREPTELELAITAERQAREVLKLAEQELTFASKQWIAAYRRVMELKDREIKGRPN